jgi:hypothetical protein
MRIDQEMTMNLPADDETGVKERFVDGCREDPDYF